MIKEEDHDIDQSNASKFEEDAYTPGSFCDIKRTRKPPIRLQDYS